MQAVTAGKYLVENSPKDHLTSLFPGSWINGNFRVWIGDKDKNRAWDLLTKTRQDLMTAQTTGAVSQKQLTSAWEALYRAEGSDWFWWYGDIYSSDNDTEFDRLFRNNLRYVYQSLGQDAPGAIDRPIAKVPGVEYRVQPAFTMTPVLDGKVTSYYEWIGACKFDVCRAGGTMSLPDARVHRIFYGFDEESLYLRVDFRKGKPLDIDAIQFVFDGKPDTRLVVKAAEQGVSKLSIKSDKGKWQEEDDCGEYAWIDVLEVKASFAQLGIKQGQELGLYCQVLKESDVVERWPLDGVIQFIVPKLEDISVNWYV